MRAVVVMMLAACAATASVASCADSNEPSFTVTEPEAGSDATSDHEVAVDANDADLDAGVLPETDSGNCSVDHWCRVDIPSKGELTAVWSFGPDDAFATGYDSTSLLHWDGTTWSIVSDPTDGGLAGLTSLWSGGPNEIWAVAQGKRRLVHGTRASAGVPFTWSVSEPATGPSREVVRGASPGDLWLTGYDDDGTAHILHGATTDGGMPTLTTLNIGVPDFTPSAFEVTAGDELWIAGNTDNAVVAHATTTGPSLVWDVSYRYPGTGFTSFNAIWGNASNAIFVIGGTLNGNDYHRSTLADGGVGWTAVPSHANTSMQGVWGSEKTDVYAVGSFGAIRHWDGTTWSVSQLAVNGIPDYANLFAIHGSSANDIWAVGDSVAVHRFVRQP